ncbi:MAG: family 20 glycosylhydrolase [Anaerolineae bacterium]|nr:family 20 glycosylhydrolase [Anaerolineae bacterium]
MIIGCLTGNGKDPLVAGSYAFCVPGLTTPLAPDLQPNCAPGSGPFAFAEGALTDGDMECTVAWRANRVGETGVDVVLQLGARCFVDHVVVRQPVQAQAGPEGAPVPGQVEAAGHVEPDGLSAVEVYAVAPGGTGLALVGRAGQRGPEVFPRGPISVGVGVETGEIVVRLVSYQRDIRLAALEVWGAGPGEPAVFPVPAAIDRLPGPPYVLSPASAIWIGPSASDDARFAATLLAEKLGETYGWTVPVTGKEGQAPAPGAIWIGEPGAFPARRRAALLAPSAPESYVLDVRAEEAILLAGDRRGLVYGVETLLQLLAAGDPAPSAAPCLIRDAPRLPFRGVHLFLPARDQIAFAKRLIRYLLVPIKLNTIFLELAGGMRFDRRPEIAETWARNNRLAAQGKAPRVPHGDLCGGGWITKAEVKDLVDYARSYGIEVIPEIQSLSHVEYLTMTYPEIAEKPVEDGYPDAYCPLHPKSREIVFDMIDEVIELLGPLRYIHMGHDEVYTMAECPRCKNKSRDELYAHDVNAIHAYLKEKGVGMMVWADMLQPWQYYSGENAAPLIPKDIVMLEFVWYFRTWADTEDILLRNGFQVIFGNCYSSHFTRYAHRTSKEGVIGAEVSVWADTTEENLGRLGKIYDMIYSANTAWSPYCQDELRWTFDRRIADMLPGIRAQLRGRAGPLSGAGGAGAPVDLGAHLNAPRRDPTGARGGYDLSTLPPGHVTLRGLPMQFGDGVILVESPHVRAGASPQEVTIPIGEQVSGLVFAHACTSMGPVARETRGREPIAQYVVRYADGSAHTIDVAYGVHVAEWNRRHGAPLGNRAHRHAGYVATYPVDPLWQAKSACGEDVTLYGLEWVNPRPEVPVASVHVDAVDAGTSAALLVAGITTV